MPRRALFALLAGAFAALALLQCSREKPSTRALAVSSETAPAQVASIPPVPSAVTSAAEQDPDLIPGARRRFAPPPDEPAPAVSAQPSGPRKKLGSFQDWVDAYDGLGTPDKNPPPRLGVLSDLPSLPSSTLVYRKSGHLVQVTLPSGKEKSLSSGPFSDTNPRWTKDGKYLFFRSTRDGAKERIFRQAMPDGKAEAVTRALYTTPYSFAWAVSDDGAKVAYVNDLQDTEGDVIVVDVATGKEEALFRGEFPSDLVFARGGKTLLFVSKLAINKRIFEIDLATRKTTALPNGGYDLVELPIELPDGRLLFAASQYAGMSARDPGFFTMPRGGGAWERLGTIRAPFGYLGALLSPDGKKLAVWRNQRQGGFGADWHTDVLLMTLDGQTGHPLARAFPSPFYSLSAPSWSPDSRHLAAVLDLCPYVGCELGMQNIVLIDTSLQEPRLIFLGYGSQPAFRPTPGR